MDIFIFSALIYELLQILCLLDPHPISRVYWEFVACLSIFLSRAKFAAITYITDCTQGQKVHHDLEIA